MDELAAIRRRQTNLFGEPEFFEFITGRAGTGKTTFVQQRRTDRKSVELCATTGVAAMNLGDTSTLNSVLGYFDLLSLRDSASSGRLLRRLEALHSAGMSELVIDEVSMLDAESLTILVDVFDRFNDEGDKVLKLTLTGDFCQLPPVQGRFAFESPRWPDAFTFGTTRLTNVWRQSDPSFKEALNRARSGDGRGALEFFSPLLQGTLAHDFDGTTIFATNAEVDRFNNRRLTALSSKDETFTTSRWGAQKQEWSKHVPDSLVLRTGAKVMVLANRRIAGSKAFEFVNGDTGIVRRRAGDAVNVSLDRGEPVLIEPITRDNLRLITDPVRQEQLAKSGSDRLRAGYGNDSEDRSTWWYECIGGIRYLPLRLAWAATTHKTQGLSMDSAQIDVGHPFFRTAGMLYVALSRARSPRGLRIVGSEHQFVSACQANPRLEGWF